MNSTDNTPIVSLTGNPYYVVAAPYLRTSAGARVMHLLCHALNRRGQTAYLIPYPSVPWRDDHTGPDLITPILTRHVIESHFKRGLAPIMVYPEVISGNPFNGPCVVRYVLNFPGLLDGDKTYPDSELCFSYSKTLAAHTRFPGNVLFTPATDTATFRPAPAGQKREGICFYAHKYQHVLGGQLMDITKGGIEITRDQPDSQTPQDIAALFHRSELFYAYENTALAIEAVLCGCPTVFLPSPHLTDSIGLQELGPEGYAWGADPAEIARAKATVAQGAANYMKRYGDFWRDLDGFIEQTQKHAQGVVYRQPVRLPKIRDMVGFAARRLAKGGILRMLQRGWKRF